MSNDPSDIRKAIQEIEERTDLTLEEKARMMQSIMTQQWKQFMNEGLPGEHEISYHSEGVFGCQHYPVNCKIYTKCCKRYFNCWRCHDEISSHSIDRTKIKKVLCLGCFTDQNIGTLCSTCGGILAKYHCKKCNLLTNGSTKNIYHCDGCGNCRNGPEREFVHCNTCKVCFNKEIYNDHICQENLFGGDCPICGENLFTSTRPITLLKCGHPLHFECFIHYGKRSFQCPVCSKAIFDMQTYYDRLDVMMSEMEMPTEYQKTVSLIYCNDCERKCTVPYHFIYHKCRFCFSYNTVIMSTKRSDDDRSTVIEDPGEEDDIVSLDEAEEM
eukprot:GHVP01050709.1.p1 GENE.GHVP01050709.1~~GHVP01050709.1.p1  ORF type:complete len:327 (+),score=28.35 GHVP01050709.1:70-1050(+)